MSGVLGTTVSNAIDAVAGSSSGTNLDSFLQKFSSNSGRYIETIDPRANFEVKFKFYPNIGQLEDYSTQLDRLGQSLVNSAKSIASNTLDNVTGGVFSSLMDKNKSIMQQRKRFKDRGAHTFLEYLAQANQLQGGEQWQNAEQGNCPLELDLGLYIQSIRAPILKMNGQGNVETPFGSFPVMGSSAGADGTIEIEFVNTKAAIHERILYPWLRECTLPWWNYNAQPYTTATITIDHTKHNDCKYVFVGCRPISINLLASDQNDAGGPNTTRSAIFIYDYMFVLSDLKINDSATDKLLGSLGDLGSSASKMMNL